MLRVCQVGLALWKTTGHGTGLYYSFHRLKKSCLYNKSNIQFGMVTVFRILFLHSGTSADVVMVEMEPVLLP